MKHLLRKFTITLTLLLTLNTIPAFASVNSNNNQEQQNLNEAIEQIITYMNENADILQVGTSNTYEIPLNNGETVRSIISLKEDNTLLKESILTKATQTEYIKPGTSYVLTWTVDRSGFLGGSFTHTLRYNTSKNLVNGKLYLNGTSSSINVTPPQFYTVKDKNSYFSKQNGNNIGTRSYVTLALNATAGIIHYNSSFKVDITAYSNYIKIDYSHNWL